MRFVETPVFTASLRRHLDDVQYRALQLTLMLRPEQGKVVRAAAAFANCDGVPRDVKAVRAELGQTQDDCALMIGVSVATLCNWEQGRRTPDGPALALLRVAARNPKAVAEALHRPSTRGAA